MSSDKLANTIHTKHGYNKDFEAISLIKEFIYKHPKTFIYFVKQGNHFPWGGNYDPKNALIKTSTNPLTINLENKKILLTHGSFYGEVPYEQGIVPMLVFGAKNAKNIKSKDYYTHFNILGSIVHDMGYDIDINWTIYSHTPKKSNAFWAGDVLGNTKKVAVPLGFNK